MRLVATGLCWDWRFVVNICIIIMVHVCGLSHFSCVQLFATLWTIACQSSLSIGFSRHEYWSGLPCLPPGDLPDPGTEPSSLVSSALTGGFFTTSTTWEGNLVMCLVVPPSWHMTRLPSDFFVGFCGHVTSCSLWTVIEYGMCYYEKIKVA